MFVHLSLSISFIFLFFSLSSCYFSFFHVCPLLLCLLLHSFPSFPFLYSLTFHLVAIFKQLLFPSDFLYLLLLFLSLSLFLTYLLSSFSSLHQSPFANVCLLFFLLFIHSFPSFSFQSLTFFPFPIRLASVYFSLLYSFTHKPSVIILSFFILYLTYFESRFFVLTLISFLFNYPNPFSLPVPFHQFIFPFFLFLPPSSNSLSPSLFFFTVSFPCLSRSLSILSTLLSFLFF